MLYDHERSYDHMGICIRLKVGLEENENVLQIRNKN